MSLNQDQAQNSSRSFYLAHQRCIEERRLPDGQIQLLVIPAIVCAAFSIELGFKAIVLQSGGSVSGHKLKELFSALEAPTQQQIVSAVGVAEGEFNTSLAEASNAFVEWRYIYERESANANVEFLSKLSKATQDARYSLNKQKRINIRMSERDLKKIRAKAIEEGIPYQSLISMLIHKYNEGKVSIDR
jgi:predicted DNA binding CopG/RHH family protein